jgi:hypothetical protein
MKGTRLRWLRLPSPAMVVALGALVMGAGGSVTAGALITSASIKDNTIRSVDVRDATLKSVDVANGTLTGADVRDGKLTGADVANNSLTGADVNESSLGKVPVAATATTAQDAGKVDGLDANALTRVARMSNNLPLTLSTADQSYGTPLSITAPAAGFVMIHGTVTIDNEGCTVGCHVTSRLSGGQPGELSNYSQASIPPPMARANVAHAWVFPVKAGVNTFHIHVWRSIGDGALHASHGELAAIYTPFGSTGGLTL